MAHLEYSGLLWYLVSAQGRKYDEQEQFLKSTALKLLKDSLWKRSLTPAIYFELDHSSTSASICCVFNTQNSWYCYSCWYTQPWTKHRLFKNFTRHVYMILIQLQWRQTSPEISKIEPHLNRGQCFVTTSKTVFVSNQCRSSPAVRGFKKERRKQYEHLQGCVATWGGDRST